MARRGPAPEAWAYGRERRPPRATIAGPDPIGRGTPQVEALSSWVARLAASHGLPLGLFVRYVLAPSLGRGRVGGASREEWGAYFSAMFSRTGGPIDGVGRTAAAWVGVLERESGQTGLDLLTLRRLAPVLSDRGLTLPIRRVCPVHLELEARAKAVTVRREGGAPTREEDRLAIHEPLLWRLGPLEVCFAHEHPVELVSTCPACGGTSPVLATWGQPGRCVGCGAWLGADLARVGPLAIDPDRLDWQRFVAAGLEGLISALQGLGRTGPERAGVAAGAAIAIERAGGTLQALAGATGYSVSLVSLWRAGRRRPSLEAALRICRATELSLADLLCGRTARGAPRSAPPGARPSVPAPSRRRVVDWAAIERAFEASLLAEPPVAAASLLAPFGVRGKAAKRHMGALFAAVAERHAAWRVVARERERTRRQGLIRQTVRDLVAARLTPGRDRVQRELPPGIWLREPDLRAAWRDEVERLGPEWPADEALPTCSLARGARCSLNGAG